MEYRTGFGSPLLGETMVKLIWPIIAAVATIIGLVYGTVAYQKAQRADVEKQVVGVFKGFQKEYKLQALLDRLIRAEEQVKIWLAYLRAHPTDVRAQDTLSYWKGTVTRLRRKILEIDGR